ncbi:hypothetical protein Mal33_31210 [Rosistilla oblonga]|uniref:Peptidase C39-like domain-containing protein n=2 Tax=Rosistilla oblonga TaxID=2527990 RepID=A0A518IVK9_9BACT|nr:hypothetical protein Mal33_31210 [Rosistilla oblonga]
MRKPAHRSRPAFDGLYRSPARMKLTLPVEIETQPTDSACGATCLQAIYRYWGVHMPVSQILADIPQLEMGGTLAVQLACHALVRGFTATIYTYNVQVFDPSWFNRPDIDLAERLQRQRECKGDSNPRLAVATDAYLRFIALGGQVRMQPLERPLIRQHLTERVPMLAGLSATFLYQEARECPQPPDERGISSIPDDLRGEPVGHFVVLSGYDDEADSVMIADPLHPNSGGASQSYYWSPIDHVAAAVLLGIVTFDSNFLVLRPQT